MNFRTAGMGCWMGRRMATMVFLFALALGGCTSYMTRPVTDFAMVAGTWDGTYTYQQSEFGSETIGATWVINPDGTYVMSTKKWVAQGRMKLQDGNIRFYAQPPGSTSYTSPTGSGIASLQQGPKGMMYLVSTGDIPGTHAAWTRVN